MVVHDTRSPADAKPFAFGGRPPSAGTRVLVLAAWEPGRHVVLPARVVTSAGRDGFDLEIRRPHRPSWSAENLRGAVVADGERVVGFCREVREGDPYRARTVGPTLVIVPAATGPRHNEPTDDSSAVREPVAVESRVPPGRPVMILVGVERTDLPGTVGVDGAAVRIARFVRWLRSRGAPDRDIVVLCSPLPENAPHLDALGIDYRPASREAFHRAVRELRAATDTGAVWLFWVGPGVTDSLGFTQRLFYADAAPDDEVNLDVEDFIHTTRTTSLRSARQILVTIDLRAVDLGSLFDPADGDDGAARGLPWESFGKGRKVGARLVSSLVGIDPTAGRPPDDTAGTARGGGDFATALLDVLEADPAAYWPPDPTALRDAVCARLSRRADLSRLRLLYRDPGAPRERILPLGVAVPAPDPNLIPALLLRPDANEDLPTLTLAAEGGQLSREPIDDPELLTLSVPQPEVSRPHCQIIPAPEGGWLVRDLASLNGTFVNGSRVLRSLLRPGDLLGLGRGVRYRVALPSSAAADPTGIRPVTLAASGGEAPPDPGAAGVAAGGAGGFGAAGGGKGAGRSLSRRRPAGAPPVHQPGDMVGGRWRIIGPLPSGERGERAEVWLGADTRGAFPASVVKVIGVEAAGEPATGPRGHYGVRRADLISAAWAAMDVRLPSPYVGQILDRGTDDSGALWSVTPHYTGGSLVRFYRGRSRRSLRQIFTLGDHILSALTVAARTGTVPHGDLRPSNILIDRSLTGRLSLEAEREDLHVRLLDWGEAWLWKLVDGSEQQSGGTPARFRGDLRRLWWSPEQRRGGQVDARSDLYGLGTLLYWACSGRLPFEIELGEADFTVERIDGLQEGGYEPEPLHNLLPAVPDSFGQLVNQLLSFRPEERVPDHGDDPAANVRVALAGAAESTDRADILVEALGEGAR